MKRIGLLIALLLWGKSASHARPIITEDVPTLGKSTFEAAFNGSWREDEFNTPTVKYRTARLPARARLGLFEKLDLGFSLTHLSHSVEVGQTKLKGSRPALFSPEVKFSANNYFGLLLVWHTALKEKPEQDIPIARGDNYQITGLFRLPFRYRTYVNLGYIARKNYNSRLGIEDGPVYSVKPGNITEAKASLEIPVGKGFMVLTELAHYTVGKRTIGGVEIADSNGSAMDLLTGLLWELKGWNVALATSFGLLDESHTSFDLERGSGDITYHLNFSYRLKARKPYQ